MSSPESTPVRNLDTAEALTMACDGAVILDVREDDEWRSGHIEGAVHVPPRGPGPGDACHRRADRRGMRVGEAFLQAAVQLTEAGHDVCNLASGMKAWRQSALPVVTDDGRPGPL